MKKHFPQSSSGVIILGGHIQALGIMRIYGRRGISVVIVDKEENCIARHSKYCYNFYNVENHNILAFLNELKTSKQYKNWIVFPTNDFHVKILSENKVALESHFNITTDKWESVEIFYNKKLSYQRVKELNIPFPKTEFPIDKSGLSLLSINYPCIIKPAIMHNFFSVTKKKVYLCKDYADLLANYDKAINIIPQDEIIIQEIIPGSSDNQFSACFLFLEGKSYVTLTACRMRQHPIDFGNATTYAETVLMPLLLEYGERLLKSVDYNGICEIEFKRDTRDGMFKFLEVNPRTWKWHSIANKAGTPFLDTYYNYLTGMQVYPGSNQKKASFFHAITDIPTVINMIFKGQLKGVRFKKPVEHAVWSFDDIKPWIYEKLYIFSLIKSRA